MTPRSAARGCAARRPFAARYLAHPVSVAAAASTAGAVAELLAGRGWSGPLDGALALAVLVVLAYPIIRRTVAGTLDIFEPIVPAALMLAALFSVRPLYMLATNQRRFVEDPRFTISAWFSYALLMALVGSACFVAGYEGYRSFRRRETTAAANGRVLRIFRAVRRIELYCGVIFVLGIVAYVAAISHGRTLGDAFHLVVSGRSGALYDVTSSSSEYLTSAPLLGSCAAILLALTGGARLSRRRLLMMLVFMSWPLAVFGVTGDRRFIIPTIAIPIVVRFLLRERRPSWLRLAAVAIAGFVALALIPELRTNGGRQAMQGPQAAVKKVLTGPDTDMIFGLSIEARLLERPSSFFYGRATVGDLLLAPIPHVVVPGKPTTARNELLIRAFGSECTAVGGTCPDFTAVGTFYQDFWWPGIVLGMLALGLASARLWERHLASPQRHTPLLFAATWTVFLPIVLRAGFMPSFTWWLYFLVPCLVGLRVGRIAKKQLVRVTANTPATAAGSPQYL
jgi:hypothetical protein